MSRLPDIVYRSLYYRRSKPHRKQLYKSLQVTLSDNRAIIIPRGFVTDLATVPRLFWGVISPSGRHDLACLVHDYLLENGWERKKADRELRFLLTRSRVHPLKTLLMYHAVRLYGHLKREPCHSES
jgi:hypothetical protein